MAYSIGVQSQAAKSSLTQDIPTLEAQDLRGLLGIVMKALMKTSEYGIPLCAIFP